MLGSTGVVKKVGLVEWGFRLCRDSRVHGLLLSPLVLSPRRLPCLAPFGSAKGPPGLLRGDLRAVLGSQKPPEELQESSRGRQESPKESPGRPQGGHKEAPEVTGGPQGAPRGRGKRKTTNFTRLSGFAARKSDVNYIVLIARPLQNHGLAILVLEKPRPNRHFWGPSCSEPRKTREICDPKLSPIIEPSWPLLGRLGALGGSWAARGGSWASLGLSPGPPEGAQSDVKHKGFAISTKSGPGPLWRRRFEIRCVLIGFGPPRARK